MSSASRRIHAASSPAENRDKYIDYVNRYYDMIHQEKLSNKKKVEEAIKRQNFDVDQIQATNVAKMEKSSSSQSLSSPPPTQPTPPFHGRPADVDVVVGQHNFRNAPRGDNFYPASPEHRCDNSDKANLSMAMQPYTYTSSPVQRVADERTYEIAPTQPATAPPPHPAHYETYAAPYDYYAPPPAPQPPAPCTCSCFRQPTLPAAVDRIPRAGYDLRELPYRNAGPPATQLWHHGQPFQRDRCGDHDDYAHQHSHPYGHCATPHYGVAQPQPPPQHFNPVEMAHSSNANGYHYYSARPPLLAKHSPCVYNVSSPLIPTQIQRNPPQKPASTSFMNSMRLEWEKNFNAARIERGNNLLKNR